MQGVPSGGADACMDRKDVISGKVLSLNFSKEWETDHHLFLRSSVGNHHHMLYVVGTSHGQTVSDTILPLLGDNSDFTKTSSISL